MFEPTSQYGEIYRRLPAPSQAYLDALSPMVLELVMYMLDCKITGAAVCDGIDGGTFLACAAWLKSGEWALDLARSNLCRPSA